MDTWRGIIVYTYSAQATTCTGIHHISLEYSNYM